MATKRKFIYDELSFQTKLEVNKIAAELSKRQYSHLPQELVILMHPRELLGMNFSAKEILGADAHFKLASDSGMIEFKFDYLTFL